MTTDHVTSAAVTRARDEVCALHAALVQNNLVAWTSGNISARVPGTGLMVIKPSGVAYADLTPESMVLCDLDGHAVEDGFSPSSDTATHASLPAPARGGRGGAHPLHVRHRVGRPGGRPCRA